jgi:hypothetical protein
MDAAMSNVIWDAIRIRRENKPPRVTDHELESLRLQAEFQGLSGDDWHRKAALAFAELQDRRWSELNG